MVGQRRPAEAHCGSSPARTPTAGPSARTPAGRHRPRRGCGQPAGRSVGQVRAVPADLDRHAGARPVRTSPPATPAAGRSSGPPRRSGPSGRRPDRGPATTPSATSRAGCAPPDSRRDPRPCPDRGRGRRPRAPEPARGPAGRRPEARRPDGPAAAAAGPAAVLADQQPGDQGAGGVVRGQRRHAQPAAAISSPATVCSRTRRSASGSVVRWIFRRSGPPFTGTG